MEEHPMFAELLMAPKPTIIKRSMVRVVNRVDSDGNSTIILVDSTPGAKAIAEVKEMVASGDISAAPVTRGATYLVWFLASPTTDDDGAVARAKVALLRELRRV